MTKIIYYGSDVHLEFGRGNLKVPECDILLLAGDIYLPHAKHRHIISKNFRQKVVKRFKKFWKEVSENVSQTYMVMGNHEHYHGDIDSTVDEIKQDLSIHPNITVLNNSTIILPELSIFGATLWTDIHSSSPRYVAEVKRGMNDYNYIKMGEARITPYETIKRNIESRGLLLDFIRLESNVPKIVMTHHAPFYLSIAPQYYANTYSAAYANTGLEHLIDEPAKFTWIHGHTHSPCEYEMGNISVKCNPRGYFGSLEADPKYQFKPLLLN